MTTKRNISAREALKEVLNQPFGKFVRDIRESDKVSQITLAKRMHVSRQFIHSVEHNKASVSLQMAIKIARALRYPHEAFLEVFLNDMLRKLGKFECKLLNKIKFNKKSLLFEINNLEKSKLVENFDRFKKLKHSSVPLKGFTEKGLYMLATILKSDKAIETTLAIIDQQLWVNS